MRRALKFKNGSNEEKSLCICGDLLGDKGLTCGIEKYVRAAGSLSNTPTFIVFALLYSPLTQAHPQLVHHGQSIF